MRVRGKRWASQAQHQPTSCPTYRAVGGCFIAGTMVHTDKGMVPIQDIKVGDLVMSQPEETGERAYRKVTKTFVHEDQPIRVIKYMLIDGEVEYNHNDYMPNDENVYHIYVTDEHPFWVEGIGWNTAKELERYQILELVNGQRAEVYLNWPVLRGAQAGFGRVCSNAYAEGREVHIVDFREGSNLWKYRWCHEHEAPVPYQNGMPDEELHIIPSRDDPDSFLKTTVYNLEVGEFHTYYVGELGVWVHNKHPSLELVRPGHGVKLPGETLVLDSETR